MNNSLTENSAGLVDACSHAYNMTNHSADDNQPGVFDESYKFTAASSHYTDNGDMDLASDFTICLWYNPSSTGAQQGLISKYNGVDTSTNYVVTLHANKSARLFVADGANLYFIYSNSTLDAGKWYHICAWFDDATNMIGLWLNNSRAGTDTGPASLATNAQGTMIGRISAAAGAYANGYIDDVWTFNTVLNSTEINNLFLYGNTTGPVAIDYVGCTINLETPTDNYHNNSAYNTFTGNLTCYQDMADNCTLYAWGIGSAFGTNTTLTNNSKFQITNNASWNDDTWTWQFNCTNGTQENASVQYDLIIDTVNPVALINAPANWTSYEWTSSNQVDLSCQDDYMYNMTADIYNADGTVWRTNVNNTDSYGNITYALTYEFTSNMSIGDYWVNLTCMDSHTKKKWKADEIVTGNMLFKVKKDGKWVTLDWDNASLPTYTELEDRIKWGFDATINSNGNIRETVKIKCDVPLYLINKENAHFICGSNWIDFQDLADQGYTFTYEQVNEQKWRVKIKKNNVGAPGTTIYLDPAVGGLNMGQAFANFSITYTPPVITYDNAATNYTLNDLHYTNITCTNGTGTANLTNMTIAFYYPNGTLTWNDTWDIPHNQTATRMARVPLNISQGGTGFYIQTTCYDNNTNYTISVHNYTITGANSITAYDGVNGSIVPNWNATIDGIVYHGGGIEDWFNDSSFDLKRWTNASAATAQVNNSIVEYGEVLTLRSEANTAVAGQSGTHTILSNTSFQGYDIHFLSRLNTSTNNIATMSVNASIFLTDGTNEYTFDTANGNNQSNWTFWTLNYSGTNITFYRDGILNNSLDVSAWNGVKLGFSAAITGALAGAIQNAQVEIDYVAYPSAWVETSTWGAGVNTLTLDNASFGPITGYSPNTFQIDTPQNGFNNTNIILNRTGFGLNAYDEQSFVQITWNATIYNDTTTYHIVNSAGDFFYAFNLTTGWAGFPTGDNVVIVVNATNYASRTYYRNISGTEYTGVQAYLLASGSGVWSTFFVVTSSWQAIANATIQFYKPVNATSAILVAEAVTDSFGSTQQYLDPLTTYVYSCSYHLYTTVTGTVTPITTTYYIIMDAPAGTMNYTEPSDYFWLAVTPTASTVHMYETIKFRINDPLYNLSWFQLAIVNSSGNTIWSQNQTTPAGGAVQINLTLIYGGGNLTNDQPFYAVYSYYRNGITRSTNRTFYPFLNHSEVTAPSFMRSMAVIQDSLGDSPSPALAIISSFVLVVLAGLVAGAIGFGGGFIVIGIGFFLAYMDFVSWTVWAIATVFAILAFLTVGRRYG